MFLIGLLYYNCMLIETEEFIYFGVSVPHACESESTMNCHMHK